MDKKQANDIRSIDEVGNDYIVGRILKINPTEKESDQIHECFIEL
jgi:hypothetical protein